MSTIDTQIDYNPAELETEIQKMWEDNCSFQVQENLNKEKFYCLSMLPYPSGELHMGHVRNYTIGDCIARWQHLLGKNVLQPLGWDSFGLPAENAAIERKLSPAEWTEKNIKKMRSLLKQLGYAIDWSREIKTSDSSYYRWEQWLFLKLYHKGLVYKKKSYVNWDPVDMTVLSNEQVVDGCGWRSGAPIERKEIDQWFFKITDYAEELLNDLDTLDTWPEQVVTMQRNWIGRSEGLEISFVFAHDPKQKLTVYTTRPDTLMGVSYMCIAIDHPLAGKAAKENKNIRDFLKNHNNTKVAEADLATQEKLGIDTGYKVLHPITKKPLPIWITNFVIMEYGTGSIMAVPAHDERDHEFALKYDLDIPPVLETKETWDYSKAAYTGYGTLINSKPFDGLSTEEASTKILNKLKKTHAAELVIKYRLRDWGISRQRYWGTPIPIVYCKNCGTVPVPLNELPVELPLDLIPDAHGSPLEKSKAFTQCLCPECGKKARRETDTMDTFVESSWYYARYCCYDQKNKMLDERAKYWTPVDQYVGGIEHACMHLIYARFIHKILCDEGLLNSKEPFKNLLTQGMVLKDGSKMSKSKGNTVSPAKFIKKFGADACRVFIIFSAPPEQAMEWSDRGVEGCYRFLKKVWHLAHIWQKFLPPKLQSVHSIELNSEDITLRHDIHSLLKQADHDMQRHQFNTVISAAMKMLNCMQTVDPKIISGEVLQESFSILLLILEPFAPHITYQLWSSSGFGEDIYQAQWPTVDSKALETTKVTLIVQINGKTRGKITVSPQANESDITDLITNDHQYDKHLQEKTIKKVIIVPKRLVNIVAN